MLFLFWCKSNTLLTTCKRYQNGWFGCVVVWKKCLCKWPAQAWRSGLKTSKPLDTWIFRSSAWNVKGFAFMKCNPEGQSTHNTMAAGPPKLSGWISWITTHLPIMTDRIQCKCLWRISKTTRWNLWPCPTDTSFLQTWFCLVLSGCIDSETAGRTPQQLWKLEQGMFFKARIIISLSVLVSADAS